MGALGTLNGLGPPLGPLKALSKPLGFLSSKKIKAKGGRCRGRKAWGALTCLCNLPVSACGNSQWFMGAPRGPRGPWELLKPPGGC